MKLLSVFSSLLISTLMLSGCFWDWEYSKQDYKTEISTIFKEVNTQTMTLSNLVGESSLQSKQDFETQGFQNALASLKNEKKKVEAMPLFRGSDEYKNILDKWIDAQIQFFEKDLFIFLSAPETATSSEDMQNTVQKMYESTKNIQSLGKKIEEIIQSLE